MSESNINRKKKDAGGGDSESGYGNSQRGSELPS